jgi:Kef-type K+ transport system membrane component KefB
MNTFGSKQVKIFTGIGLITNIVVALIFFLFQRKGSEVSVALGRFFAKIIITYFSLLLSAIYYLILGSMKRRNINKDEAITIAICCLIFMVILQCLICYAVS